MPRKKERDEKKNNTRTEENSDPSFMSVNSSERFGGVHVRQNNKEENELDEQETIVKLIKFVLKFIYNSIYQLLIYISYFNRNLVIHQTFKLFAYHC